MNRFNPPPGWPPLPPGWSPPPGWQPDPSWQPLPPGWQLWVPDSDSDSRALSGTASAALPEGDTRVSATQPIGGDRPQRGRGPAHATWSPRGAWVRFRRFPTWAKILLVLLFVGLLPFLLITAGVIAVGIGGVALARGPLPRFGITRRATAGLALVLGVVSILAGSAMAVPYFSPTTSAPLAQPTAAVPTLAQVVPPLPTTTQLAPTTTHPPTATRPPTTLPPSPGSPKAPVTSRLPRPSTRPPVTATVHTAAHANCTIEVEYKSGPSTAAGLYPKTASASGAVSWNWVVGTRTTPGDWPVTVTCTRGGAVESDQQFLTVIDTGKPG